MQIRRGKGKPQKLVNIKIKPLERPDSIYLSCAEGWLELGDWQVVNDNYSFLQRQL